MPVDLQAELANLVEQGASQPVPAPSHGEPAPILSNPPLKDYIQRSYNGDDGSKVTVYSNTGKRQSPEMFDKAVQHYSETGKDLKGFTILQPGVMDTLRSAFEMVNQPIQRELPKALATGSAHAIAPVSSLLRQLGLISPETHEAVQQRAQSAGSKVGQFLGSAFDTPEKAGMAAGTVAGGLATGGATWLPQALGASAGAMGGMAAGGALTGNTPPLEDVIIAGATAAAAQGFTSLVKYTLGAGTSEAAQKMVSSKVLDLVKSKYGAGANAHVLEQLGSNPADVARLTNIGLDAIIGDLRASTAQLRPDLMQNLPRTLTTGAQNTLRAQIRKAEDAITTYLGDVSKKGAEQYYKDTFNDAMSRMAEVIVEDFKGLGKPAIQKAVNNINHTMMNYAAQVDGLKPGATLLQALKDSSAQSGFNARSFQQTLQNYQQTPGTLMGDIGDAARRSAPFGAVDRNIGGSLPIGKALNLPWGLDRLGFTVKGGTSYVGMGAGNTPLVNAAGAVTTNQAIRDFLGRRKDGTSSR